MLLLLFLLFAPEVASVALAVIHGVAVAADAVVILSLLLSLLMLSLLLLSLLMRCLQYFAGGMAPDIAGTVCSQPTTNQEGIIVAICCY